MNIALGSMVGWERISNPTNQPSAMLILSMFNFQFSIRTARTNITADPDDISS
jgi:hypothetical protein